MSTARSRPGRTHFNDCHYVRSGHALMTLILPDDLFDSI